LLTATRGNQLPELRWRSLGGLGGVAHDFGGAPDQTEERITAYNECFIDATPEAVFAVLSDAGSYDRWVVSAKDVRDADSSWPEPGSRLYHSVGVGPLVLKDSTKVILSVAPRRLLLAARGRPFGVAHIDFELTHERTGTRVRLREWVAKPWFFAALNPVLDPLVRLRNAETLRRLTGVVTGRRGAEARA
jgi:hypothetical protein